MEIIDRQGGLACYSPWDHKESDMTEWLNWTDCIIFVFSFGNFPFSFSPFWRRQWQPTPVLLPGKSHGQRSLVGYSPRGREVRHDWVTSLSLFTFMHWSRKWQPTPVFLPGESQGQEPGGLLSMGLHRVGHDSSDLAAAAAAIVPFPITLSSRILNFLNRLSIF